MRGSSSVAATEAGWEYGIRLTHPSSDDAIDQRLRESGLSTWAATEALRSTREIAERCNVILPKAGRLRYPLKDQTTLDQAGFNGYRLMRFRRFYEGKKMVREQKWQLVYKPVTEYVRRGTNADPAAKMPPEKEIHTPKAPKKDDMNEERVILVQ